MRALGQKPAVPGINRPLAGAEHLASIGMLLLPEGAHRAMGHRPPTSVIRTTQTVTSGIPVPARLAE